MPAMSSISELTALRADMHSLHARTVIKARCYMNDDPCRGPVREEGLSLV